MPENQDTYQKTKEERAYLKKVTKIRKKKESDFKKVVFSYLGRVQKNIIDAVNTHEKNIGFVEANINEYLKDDKILIDIVNHVTDIGVTFAKFTYESLTEQSKVKRDNTIGVSINFFSEKWRKQLEQYAIEHSSQMITLINNTTRDKVKKALAESALKGYGADKTARLIKKTGAFNNARALKIARTETSAGQERGSYISAQSFGVKLKKKWLSAHDERTRPAHAQADGQLVKFDDMFSVGGAKMKYPCDPNGGTQNVINCRCTCLYVPDRSIESTPEIQPISTTQSSANNDLRDVYNLLAGLLVNEVVS